MKRRIKGLAGTGHLLIGCDFDGTLAPIAPRPDLVRASPGVLEALRSAAHLPHTSVAVVSGRALADLRSKLGECAGFWLVGCHGGSMSGPGVERHPPDVSSRLNAVSKALVHAAPEVLGFIHERKPSGIAVHYRSVEPVEVQRILPILSEGIAMPAGLRVRRGKMVVEFMAGDADKGQALAEIKERVGATGVIFVGDDQTDEDAFRVMGPGDAAIKIGTHPTDAEFAADTLEQAQAIIIDLVSQRRNMVAASVGHAVPEV